MNPGQKQFYDFILERVKPENAGAAKAMLEENFSKQAQGRFTREDIAGFSTAIMAMLKPEAMDEVQAAMRHFAGTFGG